MSVHITGGEGFSLEPPFGRRDRHPRGEIAQVVYIFSCLDLVSTSNQGHAMWGDRDRFVPILARRLYPPI